MISYLKSVVLSGQVKEVGLRLAWERKSLPLPQKARKRPQKGIGFPLSPAGEGQGGGIHAQQLWVFKTPLKDG